MRKSKFRLFFLTSHLSISNGRLRKTDDLDRIPGGRGDCIREGRGRERGLRILMSYDKTKTRFTRLVRLDPKQLAWLKENKDTRTVAGFLDKIINEYKR